MHQLPYYQVCSSTSWPAMTILPAEMPCCHSTVTMLHATSPFGYKELEENRAEGWILSVKKGARGRAVEEKTKEDKERVLVGEGGARTVCLGWKIKRMSNRKKGK